MPDVAAGSDVTGTPEADDRSGPQVWKRPAWAVPTSDEAASDRLRSKRRRRRVVLLVLAALVVLVMVVAEVAGRRYLAGQVETRLRSSGITGDVEVSVGEAWRPVVVPALLTGQVDHLRVTIDDGTVGGLPVRQARYDLRGIDGDLSLLSGAFHVRSIDAGDVRIEIDPTALGSVTGTAMRIKDGRLVAGDDRASVEVKVKGSSLILGGEAEKLWGGPIEVPIIDDWLLPCTPKARLSARTMVLSCTGTKVPGVLIDPLGGDPSPTAPSGELVPPQSTVLGGTGGGTDAGPDATTVPSTAAPETATSTTAAPLAAVPPAVAPPAAAQPAAPEATVLPQP